MTATTYNRNTNALKDVCTEVETQTRGEKNPVSNASQSEASIRSRLSANHKISITPQLGIGIRSHSEKGETLPGWPKLNIKCRWVDWIFNRWTYQVAGTVSLSPGLETRASGEHTASHLTP